MYAKIQRLLDNLGSVHEQVHFSLNTDSSGPDHRSDHFILRNTTTYMALSDKERVRYLEEAVVWLQNEALQIKDGMRELQ